MYIPRHNEEKHVPVMHALIVSRPLGTLVTLGASCLFSSHIPMILEDDGSQFGVLKGHISRANTQWRDFVTTWNYVVVHAYGPLKVIQDEQWLLTNVEKLTKIHEAGSPAPWRVSERCARRLHPTAIEGDCRSGTADPAA
jgi:transcriptional regulator